MTPVSGTMGIKGPAARGAFSVNRNARVFLSGDHSGSARKPLRLVNLCAAPSSTPATYRFDCPSLSASERKARCSLSGDHAIVSSLAAGMSLPAEIRLGLELGDLKS